MVLILFGIKIYLGLEIQKLDFEDYKIKIFN